MKKLFAMLLSFAMLFTLAMPAMAAEVTGGTEGEVSGTFNPEIAFTGVEVSNQYDLIDKGNGNYIAVVAPGDTGTDITFKYVGKNLEYLTADNTLLKTRSDNSILGVCEDPLDSMIESGFTGTCYNWKDGTWLKFEYSNDGGATWEGVHVDIKQGYTIINGTTDTNGTVTVPEFAVPGETVTVTVKPNTDYGLDKLTVTDADGNPVTVDSNNQFTMPESAVTVSATFKYTGTYDIIVNDTENGTVTANPDKATVGTPVFLTVTPDDDYELDTLDANQSAIILEKRDETTYYFIMPERAVTVNATFKKIQRAINIGTFENGTVTANRDTAATGETVRLTVEPAATYMLDTLKVTNDTTDEEIAIAVDNSFVMPKSTVTVTATFKEMPITSVQITWGSMSFTYDDTLDEDGNEKGWTNDGTEGAGTVTVTNTGDEGDNTFTAQAAYESYADYTAITGKFDVESAELAVGKSQTFTLTLENKPETALTAGTKIGKVTITIIEAAEG